MEDPGRDGRIILRWILRKWDAVGMDWIEMAEDRDRLQALVNAVMNLQVPYDAGNFLRTLLRGVSNSITFPNNQQPFLNVRHVNSKVITD